MDEHFFVTIMHNFNASTPISIVKTVLGFSLFLLQGIFCIELQSLKAISLLFMLHLKTEKVIQVLV